MMFHDSLLLYLKRNSLEVYIQKAFSSSPILIETISLEVSNEKTLAETIAQYSHMATYVLLSNEICYFAQVPLTKEIDEYSKLSKIESEVFEEAQNIIPDTFDSTQLQLLSLNWEEKNAQVMVPVISVFSKLEKVLHSNDELQVRVIASETQASEFHSQPLLGILKMKNSENTFSTSRIANSFALYLLLFFVIGVIVTATVTVVGYRYYQTTLIDPGTLTN